MTEDKDHFLKERVKSAINKDMNDSAIGINVECREGTVRLWGMVDVLAEKIAAEKLARDVYGVQAVDNGLTVAMDNFLPDKDINALVLERFSRAQMADIRKLGAETKDGVVFLQGHAPTVGVVREAERLATQVRGVKQVVSQIKVGEDLNLDDATITNAVERAFVNSDIVNARQVNTSTRNGVVKLHGMVDSVEDIENAVEIAYRVPGVKAVHSELKARHGVTDTDRDLTNKLRAMLSEEENLSRGTITAYVVNGIAFLSGEVFEIDDKLRAEEVTRQLDGLTGISNTIQVSAHNLS
ncbi:MAG TPA: BON domain-containing protein [Desulfobacteria bacterium]|nr:BON domain-containing protein [Desulfobacteria bacterium]